VEKKAQKVARGFDFVVAIDTISRKRKKSKISYIEKKSIVYSFIFHPNKCINVNVR